jgi:hypothetical protein
MNRGKLVILLTVLLAAGIAFASVWYFHQQSNRVIQALTAQVGMLIEYAPLVQVARIATEAAAKNEMDPAKIVRLQGKPYWVFDRHDVVPGKDFFNVRSWLIHNDNYDWGASPDVHAGDWQYNLSFIDGPRRTELLFDLTNARMMLLPENTILSVRPMVDGLQAFFTAQFPIAEKPPEKHE